MRSSTIVTFIFGSIVASPVAAQVVPDTTLPNNSIVTSNTSTPFDSAQGEPLGVPVFTINGGTTAGTNLFHSFSEFSVPTGTEAAFNNAVSIENIITRVTGGNISDINGLIRANGTANLFLLNPNGIVFGENARLAIGGSFFGSTATSLQFGDGVEFNSVAPEANPILTVSVPVGLQLAERSRSQPSAPIGERGAIAVNNTGISDVVPTDNFGLSVAPSQTLALVGNDVNFSGGIVSAPSGRIEIGSVVDGEVGIISTPVGLELNYNNVNEFGDIQLSNRTSLFSPAVFDNPNSAIALFGGNIILNRSQIVSLTNGTVSSGDIVVNAAETLDVGGTIATFPFSSWIVNQVAPGATGNSGKIRIDASQLNIANGARIQTLSFGSGAAGNVTVNATDAIQISGFAIPPGLDLNPDPSAIANIDTRELLENSTHSRISSDNLGTGSGGNVRVLAGEIAFSEGSQISTLAGRQALGNGGNVTVEVANIAGENAFVLNPLVPSGIGSYTLGNAMGGDVNVAADNVTFFDGAEIFSFTQGSGRGGNITVGISGALVAEEVNSQFPVLQSGIGSFVFGSGHGGDIDATIETIALSSGGGFNSVVLIPFFGMAVPNAATGNAGHITVEADTINLAGASAITTEGSSSLASITFGSGDAGNIDISARQVNLEGGAVLLSTTVLSSSVFGNLIPGSGTGNTGNTTVIASESIEISGANPVSGQTSLAGTASAAIGNAGNTLVRAPRIVLRDGGVLGSTVLATGNSGQLTVEADEITIDGTTSGGIPAQISASAVVFPVAAQEVFLLPPLPIGNTGEVTVNADRISIGNRGSINVRHPGTGNAGELDIISDRIILDTGSNISATTAFGFGGNVDIHTRSLQLRNGSQINVEAFEGTGNGGNLNINANTIVALENSDIVANSVGGDGGNIDITTQAIFGTEFRPLLTPESDITASSQLGVEGTVQLNTPEVDSTSGLYGLRTETIDVAAIEFESCENYLSSEFYYTGRGGIPENPRQFLEIQMALEDLGELDPLPDNREEANSSSFILHPSSLPQEATSWTIAPDGKIALVSQLPTNATLPQPSCQ